MYEALAQRYGGYPWAIGNEPAHAVYRHLWLMSFARADCGASSAPPSGDDLMREMLLSRAVVAEG